MKPLSFQKIFKNIPRKYVVWLVLFLLVIGLASFSNLNSWRAINNRASESKLQGENNKEVSNEIITIFSEIDTSERSGGPLTETFPVQASLENPVVSSTSILPEQKIEVIIGISLQVIKNHCNLGDIDGKTLLCPLVKELALRDLKKLNEAFQGTGKSFEFKMFDRPWDQMRDTSICGAASGGQTLPALSCSIKNNKMLYIAILHVAGESRSGGNTDGGSSVVRYTAPAKNIRRDEKDYWETPEQHLYSWEVLIHEVDHKVGIHHFPSVEPKDNGVQKIGFSASSLKGDEIFHGDLFDPGKRREWAYELSKRCEFSVSGLCSHIYDVPNQLTIEFSESGGGEYTIYGDTYKQSAHIIENKIITSGRVEESGKIMLGEIKTLFNKHELLFIVISRGNQQYHFWLNRMDLNLRYWNGETDKAIIYKELGTVRVHKEPIFIKGSVSSKLSYTLPVSMILYSIKYSDRSKTEYTFNAGGVNGEIMTDPTKNIVYQFIVDENKDYGIFAVPREETKPVTVSIEKCSGKIDDKDVKKGCLIRGPGTAYFVLSE